MLLRRSVPAGFEAARAATRAEIEAGRALLSAVTAVELLVGARDDAAVDRLRPLLDALPVVAADRDVAVLAGRLGAAARSRGATIPVPDLLIAATAIHLDIPLLTCDGDFARGRALGQGPGASPSWAALRLHPASASGTSDR